EVSLEHGNIQKKQRGMGAFTDSAGWNRWVKSPNLRDSTQGRKRFQIVRNRRRSESALLTIIKALRRRGRTMEEKREVWTHACCLVKRSSHGRQRLFLRHRSAIGGRRLGQVHANGLPAVTFSTPPEFKGEAGFWTPEHLFVASAEACLMATFL